MNNCYYLRIRYEIVQICEPMDLHNKKIIPNYDAILEERIVEQLKRMNYDNV